MSTTSLQQLLDQSDTQWCVAALESVSSTMEEARARESLVSATTPLLVTAEKQSQGRGRQGAPWIDGPRDILMTIGLCSLGAPSDLSAFSLASALAVSEALRSFNVDAGVKWPNDILHNVSLDKIGGILLERTARGDMSLLWIGIGINWSTRSDRSEKFRWPARGLEDCVLSLPSRNEIICKIATTIWAFWDMYLRRGFKVFADLWRHHDTLIEQEVILLQGETMVTGRCRGVECDGRLMLDRSGRLENFNSGSLLLKKMLPSTIGQ